MDNTNIYGTNMEKESLKGDQWGAISELEVKSKEYYQKSQGMREFKEDSCGQCLRPQIKAVESIVSGI